MLEESFRKFALAQRPRHVYLKNPDRPDWFEAPEGAEASMSKSNTQKKEFEQGSTENYLRSNISVTRKLLQATQYNAKGKRTGETGFGTKEEKVAVFNAIRDYLKVDILDENYQEISSKLRTVLDKYLKKYEKNYDQILKRESMVANKPVKDQEDMRENEMRYMLDMQANIMAEAETLKKMKNFPTDAYNRVQEYAKLSEEKRRENMQDWSSALTEVVSFVKDQKKEKVSGKEYKELLKYIKELPEQRDFDQEAEEMDAQDLKRMKLSREYYAEQKLTFQEKIETVKFYRMDRGDLGGVFKENIDAIIEFLEDKITDPDKYEAFEKQVEEYGYKTQRDKMEYFKKYIDEFIKECEGKSKEGNFWSDMGVVDNVLSAGYKPTDAGKDIQAVQDAIAFISNKGVLYEPQNAKETKALNKSRKLVISHYNKYANFYDEKLTEGAMEKKREERGPVVTEEKPVTEVAEKDILKKYNLAKLSKKQSEDLEEMDSWLDPKNKNEAKQAFSAFTKLHGAGIEGASTTIAEGMSAIWIKNNNKADDIKNFFNKTLEWKNYLDENLGILSKVLNSNKVRDNIGELIVGANNVSDKKAEKYFGKIKSLLEVVKDVNLIKRSLGKVRYGKLGYIEGFIVEPGSEKVEVKVKGIKEQGWVSKLFVKPKIYEENLVLIQEDGTINEQIIKQLKEKIKEDKNKLEGKGDEVA